MNIPKEYKKMIVDEFKEILILCNDSSLIDDKLFFFSASYGTVRRVMNLHFDPTLAFMHLVLQNAHQSFTQRLNQPQKTDTKFSKTPKSFWDALIKSYEALINAFEGDNVNEVRECLEAISYIAYMTTGNGYYLYLRGKTLIPTNPETAVECAE